MMINDYAMKFLMNDYVSKRQALELAEAAEQELLAKLATAAESTRAPQQKIDVFGAWRAALKRAANPPADPVYTTAELRCVNC